MTSTRWSPSGIAYERSGPRGELPVVLIHAGVADRRMWDQQWSALTALHDVVRLDLRGFGESSQRPKGLLCASDDVLETLGFLDIPRCHLVGASFGAGVAVEIALSTPAQVASMMLVAPGGSLIPRATEDLQAFFDSERSALAAGDLEEALEANVRCWVDGPRRGADAVDQEVRELVREMQRLAFELTSEWDDAEEKEAHPPPLDRLTEVGVRTLVLVGAEDLDAIHEAADRVTEDIAGARRVDWSDTAHLPSMERPADFLALLRNWLES